MQPDRQQPTAEATDRGGPAGMTFRWKNLALFLLTIVVLALCLMMLRAFLPAIVGAIVLAVATQRPFSWLRAKVGNAGAASSIAVCMSTLCIIVPGLFLGRTVAEYAITIGRMLRNGTIAKSLLTAVDNYPWLASAVQESSNFLAWSKAAERAAAYIATNAVTVLSNSALALTQTIIMLFLLFFLYRDGEDALRFLYCLLPMDKDEARSLVKGVEETIRATFLGHFVVAVIQGLIAGIIFASLGVSNAALLGVLTSIAALLPYFGAYVVWLPVAVFLGISGHWIKGIILVLLGALIISTLDNFLYPMLVGAQLRQHTALIFLALLGGIWLFGISGLILGPVLFSVASSLLTIWHERNHAHTLPNSS
jgi:predicted PurR-regulated permease PerM